MTLRRWGVVNAPGTELIEREGMPRIVEGLLGGAILVGPTAKGKLNDWEEVVSWPDFLKKCGDIVPYSYVAHAAKGYFTESRGNGRLYILRVSDGKQKSATLKFYIPDTTVAGADLAFTLTAKNPGSWAGARATELVSVSAKTGNDVTVTYSGTPDKGCFTGGKLMDPAAPGTIYNIILHNGATLTLDQAFAGTPPVTLCRVWKENDDCMKVAVQRSQQNSELFNILVYFGSSLVAFYENLSMDAASDRYAEDIINTDLNNHWFTIDVDWAGPSFAVTKLPVQEYGIAAVVTINADLSGGTLEALNANMTSRNLVGEEGQSRYSEWVGCKVYKFNLTTGALTGGWRISAVTDNTAADGVKFSLEGNLTGLVVTDKFIIDGPIGFNGGYDGEFAVTGATLAAEAAAQLQVSTTALRTLVKPEYGFLKLAIPGYGGDANVAALYAAAKAVCEEFNWQLRYEGASDDEYATLKTNIETTYGRSDFAKAHFPCWMRVMDNSVLYTIPNIGDILGVEARIAVAYRGYYKAAAGIDAILSRSLGQVVGTNTDYKLEAADVELLNPAGINCLVKKFGNLVIWGDRTLSATSTWRWAHMREQMSHYEHVLLFAMDWLNFAINNPQLWPVLYNYLEDYFFPQYKLGALMGKTFEDACAIVVDSTNNNQQTIDDGEVNAEVTLQFPGTVEKVRIGIGRAAITEKVLV